MDQCHSHKALPRILAANRHDIIQPPKWNPVMNPEKDHLKRLKPEQGRFYGVVRGESLLRHFLQNNGDRSTDRSRQTPLAEADAHILAALLFRAAADENAT